GPGQVRQPGRSPGAGGTAAGGAAAVQDRAGGCGDQRRAAGDGGRFYALCRFLFRQPVHRLGGAGPHRPCQGPGAGHPQTDRAGAGQAETDERRPRRPAGGRAGAAGTDRHRRRIKTGKGESHGRTMGLSLFCGKMERALDIERRLWYSEATESKLSIMAAERGRFMKNRLEELRKARGIKQEELASALEVSRQTIGSLENGRYNPSILLAFKIARYFGLAIEDIFIYEEEGDT